MKTLLITGANSGIGYYMVAQWLKTGNRAAVIDLTIEQLTELQKRYPDKLLVFQGDVCKLEDVKNAADKTTDKFGSIDYAIHNACVCVFKSFSTHTFEDYGRVMHVNLHGAINLTKAVLPTMRSNESGKVCITSSGVGITGYVNISAYSASKGAIEAFAKCMNLEHKGSGVTFHLLHPPLTDTASCSPLPVPKEFKASPEKVGKGLIKHIDQKKFVITPSLGTALSVRFSYLFPRAMGNLLAKMTDKTNPSA